MLIFCPIRAKKHRRTRKPLVAMRDPHRTPPAVQRSFNVVWSRRYHVQSKHGWSLLQPVKNATYEPVQETGEHTHLYTAGLRCTLQGMFGLDLSSGAGSWFSNHQRRQQGRHKPRRLGSRSNVCVVDCISPPSISVCIWSRKPQSEWTNTLPGLFSSSHKAQTGGTTSTRHQAVNTKHPQEKQTRE